MPGTKAEGGETITHLEKFQIMDLFVDVVVLLLMFMYLVLFAALALKIGHPLSKGQVPE